MFRNLAILLTAVALLACCGADQMLEDALVPPEPNLYVLDAECTSDCSTLFDVCTTAHCSVGNSGEAAGEAAINFMVSTDGGSSWAYNYTKRVTLQPGDLYTYKHDFPEVSLGDTVMCRCVVR